MEEMVSERDEKKAKINILFIITKLQLGGAQLQLLEVLKRIDKRKFNIFLFSSSKGMLVRDSMNIKHLHFKKSRYLDRPINLFKDICAFIELAIFIRDKNIDIVHTHSSKAGILGRLAAKLMGVKVILHTVHGWSFNQYQPFLIRKFFILLERICAHFSDKIVVVSEWDREVGLNNKIGSKEKYTLIRYGLDFKYWLKDTLSSKDECRNIRIVNISCFKPQKNLKDYIKVCFIISKVLSCVEFLLVGDGILRPQIEKWIKRYSLHGRLLLWGWRRDIKDILSKSDIFVLTSLWEGLPVSMLEAMSLGLGVVVSDTGGVREIVREGINGFIVSKKDFKTMAKRILEIIKNEELKKFISKNARSTIKKMKLDINLRVRRLEELYTQLYDN